jgi:hypothetical protein
VIVFLKGMPKRLQLSLLNLRLKKLIQADFHFLLSFRFSRDLYGSLQCNDVGSARSLGVGLQERDGSGQIDGLLGVAEIIGVTRS